ncbi:hypothetical protein WJ32_18510 (plasmid) [Burkholderia ubonensis]|uniref:Flagellar basal-body/hook protein C-terminal domain-containing protein n=2 Tax=Burkholderia ubonensis TaxID=101571 RepID=A0A118HW06_9BURK|nr:hypothetical protein WJ32_18510 [Burkholderia ubonensis]KVG71118.1 hypothetical protein WJ33_21230 [Burkholderia ubonensis]
MISVPRDASNIAISRDGEVTAVVADQVQHLGSIELVHVTDTGQLTETGSGHYRGPADGLEISSGRPGAEGGATIAQGFSEASNVKLQDEMVSLLMLQRAYSASAHVIQTGDDLMNIANQLKR